MNSDDTLDTENSGSTIRRAASAAHETVDKVASNAEKAEEKIRKTASDAEHRVKDTADKAKVRSAEMTDSLRLEILEHPIASVGIAFAAGYLLSIMMRR